MKNKNLILFIVIGFIVTTTLWGLVGGCGTSHMTLKKEPQTVPSGDESAEGLILEKIKGEVPSEKESSKGGTYIVENGDTLWGISKKFGVSVSSIKEANNLKEDIISAGQRLLIPGLVEPQAVKKVEPKSPKAPVISTERSVEPVSEKPKATPKPGLVVYKVRKDDSLWRIAQIYGTTIEHIAELNGLPKNAKLVPGQEILVPSNE